jgi:potassium/hydrogen antiporter
VDVHGLAVVSLVASAIVLVAVVGVRLAGRFGVPGLLLFLAIGLVLGSTLDPFDFENSQLAVVLGYFALVLILAEGGLSTRAEQLRPVLWPSLVLATIGVAVSIAIVASALALILGLDWQLAILLGAVLAPTDAAAVFSVLRPLKLNSKLRTMLEAEAGFNDAPIVVLVLAVSSTSWGTTPWWLLPIIVVAELIGGAIVGVTFGKAARWALPRLALPAAGLYPIAALAFLVAAFAAAQLIHSSGFLAVYVAGILVGNTKHFQHRRSVLGFSQAVAWCAEIGLFVMLGMLAEVWRLPQAALIALVAGLALVLLGRPASALVSLAPFRLPKTWVVFTSAAGLRGAVPIVFAAIPLSAGVKDSSIVFDATLLIVLVLTILQTPSLGWLARRLNVVTSGESQELGVDAAPLDGMNAVALSVDVPSESQLVGVYIEELGLPKRVVVSLVVRDDQPIVPDKYTRIRSRDRLLVIAHEDTRDVTEARLRAIGRSGPFASWRGDAGEQE